MHISYSSKLIIYVAGIMQVSFTNVIVDCLKLCNDNIQNPTTCIFLRPIVHERADWVNEVLKLDFVLYFMHF